MQSKLWRLNQLVGLAVCFVLISVFIRFRLDTPAPAPVTQAANARFSAEEAMKIDSTVLAGNTPHPVDSAANDAVRGRVVELLRQYGYRPNVEESTSCRQGRSFVCARVKNITAMLAGSEPGQLIMLAAHYDSVRAGPGASDDGSGVGVLLEVARILKSLPLARHGVLFVFTDGEEAGLLGARAFIRNDVRAHNIAAVINLEARGTTGQSTLFETGPASGWLVRAFGDSARRPSANSTVSALYRLLPNDTDLTIFKSHGMQGLNFAYGENEGYYHTPHDDLQSLDPGSIQHQGDNVYDLVRRLRDEAFPTRETMGNLIYADILGMGLVTWTATTGWLLWIGSLVGLGVAHRRLRDLMSKGRGSVVRGFLLVPLSIILAAAVAYVLTLVLAAVGGGSPAWHTAHLPNRWLLWVSILLAVGGLQRRFARGADSLALWFGVGYAWCALGLLAMMWLPGTSYLFAIPTVAMALVAIAISLGRRRSSELQLLAILPALLAFVLLLPIVFLTEIMLGFNVLAGVLGMAALIGLASTFAVPLLAAPALGLRYFALGAAVVIVASGALSISAANFTSSQPKRVNVLYVQNVPGEAYLVSSKTIATASMARSMGREASVREVVPELKTKFFAVPVASAGLSPARLSILDERRVVDGIQLTMALDADDGTDGIEILFPKAMHVRSLETDGQRKDYATASGKTGDYDSFVCIGESCRSRRLSVVFSARTTQPVVLQRLTHLPALAAGLVRARNEGAVAEQDGDMAVVVDRIRL